MREGCQEKDGIVRLMQKRYLAGDTYFVTGFIGKKPAGTKKQKTPKAGHRVRKGAVCRHSLPTHLSLSPQGLEGLGRNYSAAKMKTSRG